MVKSVKLNTIEQNRLETTTSTHFNMHLFVIWCCKKKVKLKKRIQKK